jgi:hypothetical protein
MSMKACCNCGVLNYTGQFYIISPFYVRLMTAAEVALSVMPPAIARTVLASNHSRGKILVEIKCINVRRNTTVFSSC